MSKRPNVIVIMTDTQNKDMIGAYGLPQMDTPALDSLAAEGVRFERAYTACPVCTPARGALFTGIHPQLNGATYNGVSPYRHIPNAGEIFRCNGYRTAYTGKWHLDGDYPYMGSGEPAPGFAPDWWYDGQRYRDDIGEDLYAQCYAGHSLERMDTMPDDPSCYWAHRVADRAVDFLRQVNNTPFFLGVSFDEPHGPFCCPPSFYRDLDPQAFPIAPTFNAAGAGKPELQSVTAFECGHCPEQDLRNHYRVYYGCNRFVDSEIGRVLDAIRLYVPDNTIVVYTSDHGHMMADHGLWSKGFWMYERSVNVPLIISGPGFARGATTQALASHVDILSTLLTQCGISPLNPLYEDGPLNRPEYTMEKNPWIDRLHGVDLAPVLRDPAARVRDQTFISFYRFGNMPRHGGAGNFYPVRCMVNDRYKLVLNMLDTDELYDLEQDPYEMRNRLYDRDCIEVRDQLHDAILDYMDQITDPLRSYLWGHRTWRSVRSMYYHRPWK